MDSPREDREFGCKKYYYSKDLVNRRAVPYQAGTTTSSSGLLVDGVVYDERKFFV